MAAHPLVSVIIGTYNREEYLRDTLASVFKQTFDDYEVVVVDDASTDGTVSILEEYGDRIRLIRRSENSGTADVPRYEAVTAARGLWCALLDSDDLWDSRKLERQVAFMKTHPEIPLSHHYVRVIDRDGREHGVRHEGVIPPTGHIGASLLEHCFICTSSAMVRKDAWLAAQKKSDLTGFGTEWDFFLSIDREHPIGFIAEVLGSYRRAATGVSQGKWKRYPRDIGAMKRIYRKGLWGGILAKADVRRLIAKASLENAQHWRHAQKASRSLYFCKEALKVAPLWTAVHAETIRCLVRSFLPANPDTQDGSPLS